MGVDEQYLFVLVYFIPRSLAICSIADLLSPSPIIKALTLQLYYQVRILILLKKVNDFLLALIFRLFR
jgi:hypothetical protein